MKSFILRALRATLRRTTGTITNVATDERALALTFDDGPDPIATPALLKILEAHGAKATFFMTGENAAAYPELVTAVRDAGHAIGNHSWDHPSFPLLSGKERRAQIRRCADVHGSTDTLMFRPPYGHQSAASEMDAWLMRHHVITWNVCVPDWEVHDGAWFADLVLQRVNPGSIILMHDGMVDFISDECLDRRPTLEAVEKILTVLSNQYMFVTVPELLRLGKPVRRNWWMEPDYESLNCLKRHTGTPRRYDISNRLSPWFGFNH